MSNWDITEWLAQGNSATVLMAGESGVISAKGDYKKTFRNMMTADIEEAYSKRSKQSSVNRRAALSEGKKRYNGKPCKYCASTARYTSTCSCVACDYRAKGASV